MGLVETTSGKAGFITGLSVVFVPFLAALLMKSPIRWTTAVSVGTAVIGLYLLTSDGVTAAVPIASASDGISGAYDWPGMPGMWGLVGTGMGRGELLVLGAAAAFAGHIVAVGRYGEDVDEYRFSMAQMGAVLLCSLIVSFLFERPWSPPNWTVIATAAFTGIIVTALVLVWQTRAQRIAEPTHAAVIFTMEPVFAALFGYLLAGEVLGPMGIGGGALILLGMIVSTMNKRVERADRARPGEKS